jgi:hypothetical protein
MQSMPVPARRLAGVAGNGRDFAADLELHTVSAAKFRTACCVPVRLVDLRHARLCAADDTISVRGQTGANAELSAEEGTQHGRFAGGRKIVRGGAGCRAS